MVSVRFDWARLIIAGVVSSVAAAVTVRGDGAPGWLALLTQLALTPVVYIYMERYEK